MKSLSVLSALTLSAMLGSASLQAQDRLTPEFLWKLGRVSEPQVSPDGNSVLYGVTTYKWEENKSFRELYLTDKSGNAKKITDTPVKESGAVWRPDGKRIGFMSAEDGSMQLWEMNPDGSDRRQVTHVVGGITGFSYSPDMTRLLYTHDVKLDPEVKDVYADLPNADARIIDGLMYRHWSDWHDYAYSHPFIIKYSDGTVSGDARDLMPTERFDCPLAPFGGMEQLAWRPDGQAIVYTSKKKNGTPEAISTNSDLYLYEIATGRTTNLTQGMMGYDQDPVWSDDGKYLAWSSMERDGYEADRNRIFLWEPATNQKRELTTGFDQNASGLSWMSDSRTLLFTTEVKGRKHACKMDVNTKAITQITHGNFDYISIAEGLGSFVAERQSMSDPTEIFWVNPNSTAEGTAITHTNDQLLAPIKRGDVVERTVKTSDGKDMLVWVVYPPDFNPAKKYPTLLYCQGGPQSTVSQFWSYRWNLQLMAANGYIVVAPNRRGLPSFGQAWNEQISGDWGGQPMRDYLAAIDDVCKEKYVNRDRLGCVGASYGGYSVYYLAGIHQKRFKCFISHCGLFNLESWYGSTEELFFANFDMKGAYWQTPQPPSYEQFSPHKFVKNWDTPILVIHGEKDFRVPVTEGMQAFQAAQLKGIPSRFLYFPEEGHWVNSPQNSILWHRVFYDWLDSHLKK
jgi:dipeptidyl aminopeptidase/acylaminoacyl peptidase